EVRHRGVAARPAALPRADLVLQHHRLSGAAPRHPLPGRERAAPRAHAERDGRHIQPHAAGADRVRPAGRRLGAHSCPAPRVRRAAGAGAARGMSDRLHPESRLLDAARTPGAGLAPSLQRSVPFHNMPPAKGGSPYGRSDVPTAAEAEGLLGALEDATSLVFASGMTAWTALCLTLLAPGRAVAIPD